MTALQDALKFIDELDWPVFPTVGKKPILSGNWESYATNDPKKVRALFKRAKAADGYAVVPPIGCLIIDYDKHVPAEGERKAKGSWAADRFYKRNIEPATRKCPRATTPSGGVHIYLEDKDQHFGGAKRLISNMPGLDCRGHAIGYVIGPNGRDRKWLNSYRLTKPMDWLLLETIKLTQPKAVKMDHKGEYPPISKNQMIDLLSHISPDMEMNQWIGVVAAIGSNFAENADLAIELADEWSQTGFLKNYNCPRYDIDSHGNPYPGDCRRQIENKIRNSRQTGNLTSVGTIVMLARKGGYSGPVGERMSFREALALQESWEEEEEDDKRSTAHVLRFDEDAGQYFPDYLVEKLLPRGVIYYLVARQNAGKTAFIAELATCVSEGIEFFGHKCEQGKVLIIEKDDWRGLHRFLYGSMLKHGLREVTVTRRNLKSLFDTSNWSAKDIEEEADYLAERFKAYDLVIFETVTSMFSAAKMDEAWAKCVANFFSALSQRLPETTLLVVSHSARAKAVEVYGSSLQTHIADGELKMDRKDDGSIELYTGKAREFHLATVNLKFMSASHRLLPRSVGYLDIDADATRRATQTSEDKFYEEKLALVQPGTYTLSEINRLFDLKKDDRNWARNELTGWRKRMVEEKIVRVKGTNSERRFHVCLPSSENNQKKAHDDAAGVS